MKRIITLMMFCIFYNALSYAETNYEEEQFSDAPTPPDIPDPLQSGQPIEPEVTIIRRDDALVEEYRVNGNLYMIKVTPSVGRPYYLVDKDGDGRMESKMSNIYDNDIVPQWVLFSW